MSWSWSSTSTVTANVPPRVKSQSWRMSFPFEVSVQVLRGTFASQSYTTNHVHCAHRVSRAYQHTSSLSTCFPRMPDGRNGPRSSTCTATNSTTQSTLSHHQHHLCLSILSARPAAEAAQATLYVYSARDTFRRQCLYDANHLSGARLQVDTRHAKFRPVESDVQGAPERGGRRSWAVGRFSSTIRHRL